MKVCSHCGHKIPVKSFRLVARFCPECGESLSPRAGPPAVGYIRAAISKVALVLSSITLLLSVIVHFSTFIPPISATMAQAWPLHLCAMASFALMIFTAIPLFRPQSRQRGEGFFAYWKRSAYESRAAKSRTLQSIPRSARIMAGVAFAYAVLNFVIFLVLVEGGVPAKKNGEYYLHSHGHKIRDLTKEEYVRKQAYVARGFSGHWIAFSLVPLLFFAYVRPRLLAEGRTPVAVVST